MANLAAALKEEIGRLARKEIKSEVDALKKTSSRYRSDIAELKRQVTAVERQLARQKKALDGKSGLQASVPEGKAVRFSAPRLKTMREKKGLSAAALGQILGVTAQTVYNWEAGTTRPRNEQIAAIAVVRATGKREIQIRMAQSNSASRSG